MGASPEELPWTPDAFVDPGGFPRFGTYRGALRDVDLRALKGPYALPLPLRWLKHKRWQYAQVCTPEVVALFTIADLTYTANAFVTVVDLKERRAVFDRGFLGGPGFATVGDRPGQGLAARFRLPGVRMSCTRGEEPCYRVEIEARGQPLGGARLAWRGEFQADGAPPPLTVIAPVPHGVVNVTQKWCNLPATGALEVGSRRYALEGGLAGLDYTQGYLARRTAWRWAMANGRLPDGTPLGFNLVEGFNEGESTANENALWVGSRLLPLGRAKFEFNKRDVLDEWRVSTSDGALELTFQPIFAHREERDYRVVSSHFAQPIGVFRGKVRLPDRSVEIADLGGVTEDQDVRW
jgi:hypothetical protein